MCASIVDLGDQAGNDLQLFLAICIVRTLDLGSFGATLLLGLARLDPFLHGEMLSDLGQVVLVQTQALKKRAVGDRVQHDMVVGAVSLLSMHSLL